MAEEVIIQVPLNVPVKIIDGGLVEIYAKDKGWVPDEQGPTAIEFLISYIRKMVKEDFERSYLNYVQIQVRDKASLEAKALFE